jgi:hypothetical protein
MSKFDWARRSLAGIALLFVAMSVARAQENRTFVSGVGDDANNCRRVTPCKTFAGALTKTNPGGEIDVLDTGGFGSFTIDKAVTIDGGGVVASALATGTVTGVIVNAGTNDVVILRHLSITAMLAQGQSGNSGIKVVAARAVYVIECLIKNFSINGIDFEPANGGALFVRDSIIINNGTQDAHAGIIIKSASGPAFASIDNTRTDGNSNGVLAQGNSKVSISNSTMTGSLRIGLFVVSDSSAPAQVNVERSVIANNRVGIQAGGCSGSGQATVLISNVSVTGNRSGGLRHQSAVSAPGCGKGEIISSRNNTILGNNPNGDPTSSFPPR